MSRTIQEIYSLAISERNKRLELNEFANDSKLSVLNGILWVVSAIIYSFETILDVFAIDISTSINQRINGTPQYYANALLQYQQGDEILVREDGLAFGYAVSDESKRVITQVSYTEVTEENYRDRKLVLKVATGEKGKLSVIEAGELQRVNSYINKFKFAGTNIEVVSLKGDVIVPRVTVYYDGAVLETAMYDAIENSLKELIMHIDFNSTVYVSNILRAIKNTDHVTDVYIDTKATPEQGIFIYYYDTDGNIKGSEKIDRMCVTESGYIRESTGRDEEENIPLFRESIILKIENAV